MSQDVLFRFKLVGEPHGKRTGTPIARRTKKTATGKVKYFGQVRKNERTRAWEDAAQAEFRRAWGGKPPLDEPIEVMILSVKTRPKYLKGKATQPAPVKPDYDNVSKSVGDAMEKAGVYVNDSRFVRATVETWFAAKGELPHVEIAILRTNKNRRRMFS